MILNFSDTLEWWTNGAIKAGVHQASAPVELQERNEGVVRDIKKNCYARNL